MKLRFAKMAGLVCVDTIVFMLIYFVCSFMINGFKVGDVGLTFVLSVVFEVIFKELVYIFSRSYNHIWIYRNKRDLLRLVMVCGFANMAVFIANFIIKMTIGNVLFFSVLLFAFCAELLYLVFSRILISYACEIIQDGPDKILKIGYIPTLIIGAGGAGELIFNEINRNDDFKLNVIGFVDDDENKIGNYFCDKMVFGPTSIINDLVEKYHVENLIIAFPSAGKERIKEIVNSINYKDLNVMILPEMVKILAGGLNSSLRKVSIADLLGRKTIELDKTGIDNFIGGKTILVTGGGGSIGSEICRQIASYKPKTLIVFDIYENTTYDLLMEFNIFFTHNPAAYRPNIIGLIGSVRDEKRLDEMFKKYRPDIVFHAAAHKHVPLMEDSPKEAIKNNVVGTYNVAKYAMKYDVKKMVMISTDKAVNPTNVMGASKRFAEMVIEAFDNESTQTRYSMVRFGNVLGSNGSVIPLFEKQIASGGPITVTSEEINRFFMTIPEAVSLVIQSGCYANGGEKFILDMGEPVKIIDLAKKMIRLSGLVEGKDIKIEITGLRPGEKLYEELLLDHSRAEKTNNDKIFVEKNDLRLTLKDIDDIIGQITNVWESNEEILKILRNIEMKRKVNETTTASIA